jgi:hypothetical protein
LLRSLEVDFHIYHPSHLTVMIIPGNRTNEKTDN